MAREETFNLKNILGSDIRSRSGGTEIERRLDTAALLGCNIVLDFTGVERISRSFADELCEIKQRHHTMPITLRGMNVPVQTMLEIVKTSRTQKRERPNTSADIHTFTSMESLSNYLMTV